LKYKVNIKKNGNWNTIVLDPGKHKCADIVNVVNSFGDVKSVKDKKDDVPLKTNIHVGRR
jgi:hypothetical protein